MHQLQLHVVDIDFNGKLELAKLKFYDIETNQMIKTLFSTWSRPLVYFNFDG